MTFSIPPNIDLPLTPQIPAELDRYLLPVIEARATANEYLKLLIQEREVDGCRILYTVYLTHRKCTIRIKDDNSRFIIYLALQHDRKLEIEGLGSIHIREGQYNLAFLPQLQILSVHDSSREYITLGLQYDRSVLEEWAPFFPALSEFLEHAKTGKPALLLKEAGWFTREIQDSIWRLIHTQEDTPAFRRHSDLLVKALFFHLMVQTVQRQPASQYSNYEIEGIHAAREMIRNNIRYHFVIREIAQKVGVNEFKLKNGFRALFGTGVYEYLRVERMAEASHLLQDTDKSIKEIATDTGYQSVNSFIKAFKKKFGITPGDYKKNLP